jgi:hypothetical protein
MSHPTTRSLPVPQPAPWRDEFLEHLQKTPEFALSTVCREPTWDVEGDADQAWHQRHKIEPRVRFCVCRGMLGAPPRPFPHPNGAAHLSESPPGTPPPAAPEAVASPAETAAPPLRFFRTDCPVFTTDDRMRKPAQMRANSAVEAAWWCKSAGVQWRIRGVARIMSAVSSHDDLGLDDGEGGETTTEEAAGAAEYHVQGGEPLQELESVEAQLAAVREAEARDAVEARMYDVVGDLAMYARWTWESEVAAWFAAQSPRIRGASRTPDCVPRFTDEARLCRQLQVPAAGAPGLRGVPAGARGRARAGAAGPEARRRRAAQLPRRGHLPRRGGEDGPVGPAGGAPDAVGV